MVITDAPGAEVAETGESLEAVRDSTELAGTEATGAELAGTAEVFGELIAGVEALAADGVTEALELEPAEPLGTELDTTDDATFEDAGTDGEAAVADVAGLLAGVATELEVGTPSLAELGALGDAAVIGKTLPGTEDEETSVAVTGQMVVYTFRLLALFITPDSDNLQGIVSVTIIVDPEPAGQLVTPAAQLVTVFIVVL